MRATRLWPAAVVAVLALTVGSSAMLVWFTRDPGLAAVEPDYYRRAVRWDSTAAEARRSAALGWRLDAALGPVGPAGAVLTARLAGPDGAPLDDADVEVTAIHNRDALHPVRARLAPAGEGAYAARLPLRHAGLWELRLAAARGADRFTVSLRRDAPPDGP
jgi:nitrogen fixation protein FixH